MNGRVVGAWTRRLGKAVAMQVRLSAPLGERETRAIAAAARRYARFMGLPLELRLS